jgi:hypothetical protein
MREGQPHAEAIVAALAREWNPDELTKRADADLLKEFPETRVRELVASWSQALGPAKSQQTLVGSTGVGVGSPSGKFASYLIELQCESGKARVNINLRKANETWSVIGFWVDVARPPPVSPSPSPAAGSWELQNNKMQQTRHG